MPPSWKCPPAHEGQSSHVGIDAGERGDGLRPLQRQQGLVGQGLDGAAMADVRHQVGQVGGLAGRVDDEEQVVLAARDHQVVEDAAVRIGEEAVALLADGKVDDIHGHQRFERRCRIGAEQADLAHVGHVEERGFGAAVLVLGHDADVLHRHFIAGERHHACTLLKVQGVEGSLEQFAGGHDDLRGHVSNHRVDGGSALAVRFT